MPEMSDRPTRFAYNPWQESALTSDQAEFLSALANENREVRALSDWVHAQASSRVAGLQGFLPAAPETPPVREEPAPDSLGPAEQNAWLDSVPED